MKYLFVFLLVITLNFEGKSQNQFYVDGSFTEIRDAFFKQDYKHFKQLVKAELQNSKPHPLTYQLVAKIIADIDPLFVNELSLQQQEIAHFVNSIRNLSDQGRGIEVYNMYRSCSFVNDLPPYTIAAIASVIEDISMEEFEKLLKITLKNHGEYYRILWRVDGDGNLGLRINLWKNIMKDNFYNNYPNFKDYINHSNIFPPEIGWRDWGAYSRIEAIRAYLENNKNDAVAYRRLAVHLKEINKYEEARQAYLISYKLDPFYYHGSSLLDAATCAYYLDQHEVADQEIREFVSRHYPNAKVEEMFLELSAEALTKGKDRNEARNRINKGLKVNPNNEHLILQLANIEYASERYKQALDGFKNLPYSTLRRDLVTYNKYLNSIKQIEDYERLLNELDNFSNAESYSQNIYWRIYDYYFNIDEKEMALDYLSKGISIFPLSAWLLRTRASLHLELKNNVEADQDIRESIKMEPNNRNALQIFKMISKEQGKNVEQELLKLFNDYPFSYELMEEVKSFKPIEEQLSFLKNSTTEYDIIKNRSISVHLKGDDAIDFHLQAIKNSKTKLDSIFNLVGLIYDQSKKAREAKIDTVTINKYLSNADLFKKLGGNLSIYHDKKAELYRSLDMPKLAKEEIGKAIEVDPYNIQLLINSIVSYNNKVFKQWREILDKDKYNYYGLTDYVRFNVLYGGSNLNAIWAYNECKTNFPNRNCSQANYFRAYKNLGDPLKEMEFYKKSTALSANTSRYINWYNNTRHSSWNATKQIDYNPDENSITIIDENGEEFLIMDHPYHSKPVLRQKGSVWVRYKYNEHGDIININTSANNNIDLSYNINRELERLNSSQHGNLFFKYDSSKRPVKVAYERDTITYHYNPINGELDSLSLQDQQSLYLVRQSISGLMELVESFDYNDIKFEDPKLEELEDIYRQSNYFLTEDSLTEEDINAHLNYAEYLKNNLKNNANYSSLALSICREMIEYLDAEIDNSLKERLVQFTIYYHEILLTIRRLGVAQDYWDSWAWTQDILEKEKQKQKKLNSYRKYIENAQKIFKNKPIKLLTTAEWLPKSDLNNEAFWTTTNLEEIFPNYTFSSTTINNIFKRGNGDVIITSNSGIALKHNGFWSFLYYDVINRKFLKNPDLIKVNSKITFHSIVESNNEELFISTSKGVFRIDNNYLQLTPIEITDNNYIGNEVCKLFWAGKSLLIYNNEYINVIDTENSLYKLQKNFSINGQVIHKILDTQSSDLDNDVNLIVQTTRGLYELSLDYTTKEHALTSLLEVTNIDDSLYSITDDLVYILNANTLYKYNYHSRDISNTPLEVFGNIIKNKHVLGLCEIPVEDKNVVGVISDIGINIFRQNHFEFFKIGAIAGLDEYTPRYFNLDTDFGIVTKTNYVEYSQRDFHYSSHFPEKIVTIKGRNVTFMLEDGNLYYSNDSDILERSVETDGWGTSIKDFDATDNGDVYFIDYQSIYKLSINYESKIDSSNYYTLDKLFEIEPHVNESFENGEGKVIKVSSDGTIWVTSNLSVFRYNESMTPKLKEFNYFKDSSDFPAKTLEVYNLIESYDNQIWVITSSEPWNDYKGVDLDGGLVVYNKDSDSFDYFDREHPIPEFPWFIKSYTQISKDEAIAGTPEGFAYHSRGGLKKIRYTTNESYINIEKDHPNLFLGTTGVQFGDFWLFGCAEGVLAYRDGQWFYPDRLNQLLPDFSRNGNWGGNKVNTLSVDHLGRLNIGTDLGLVVINANKISPIDLLMMSQEMDKVVEYHNIDKLKQERELIVSSLPQNSASKQTIDRVQELQDEIGQLKKLKNSFTKDYQVSKSEYKTINIDSIDSEIKRISRKHSSLLLTLKEKNPVLYQTLKIPPLSIAGIRKKLKEDECIVQYIPLENKLIIQVVSQQKTILKEVNVTKNELFNLSLIASDLLSNRNEIRGAKLGSIEELTKIDVNMVLEQLYNHLLSPIQRDLSPYKQNVQIIVEGALNYIPFEALVYKDGKGGRHYAIEDYNFVYLSSLYMFQLLFEFPELIYSSILLIGDPDYSLPHARKEVEEISTIVGQTPFIGKEASLDQFKKHSKNKNIIHLATHGYLDKKSIKDSWLLFSDQKLKLSEVYELSLDNTNLMVLSACETSLGKDGIETTTIARAFANSGVKNLIASLWRVNDESTKILMTKFYDEVNGGSSYMKALHTAKMYLKEHDNGRFNDPKFWSPFILFGKS